MLKKGQEAPNWTATIEDDTEVSLGQYRGKKVVLFFYPKDNTPTCTTEACNLRDNHEAFLSKGYVVLGVSPDSTKKHRNFIKKYNLPYSLISDPDHKLLKAYGVWGKKMLFGRKYMGLIRTTFVIDELGVIEDIITNVKAKEHSDQIMR